MCIVHSPLTLTRGQKEIAKQLPGATTVLGEVKSPTPAETILTRKK